MMLIRVFMLGYLPEQTELLKLASSKQFVKVYVGMNKTR